MRSSDLNIDRIYVNRIVRSADYEMVKNHFHYYYELFYVQQGTARFFINNKLYDLHSGDFLVIPPREVHFNRYITQCNRYNIYFKKEDLFDGEEPFMEGLNPFLELGLFHIHSSYRPQMEALLNSMLLEEKVNDDSTKELQSLMLRAFLLYSKRYASYEKRESFLPKEGDALILEAARYISEHFHQNITLDQLANKIGLSPSYFSKKFRHITGMGMKEYLIFVRLEHASMELRSTNHSITEVAINSGFNDSNYFKDAFKKMYGLSPRAYRNSISTDEIMAKHP